jgi:hypothetical protein
MGIEPKEKRNAFESDRKTQSNTTLETSTQQLSQRKRQM